MFSATGGEDSLVADCPTDVGSVLIDGLACSVGDVGVLMHPTSVAITIKIRLMRNIFTPFEPGSTVGINRAEPTQGVGPATEVCGYVLLWAALMHV